MNDREPLADYQQLREAVRRRYVGSDCKAQIVLEEKGDHGYRGDFTEKSFWFECGTHRIECDGPFPNGYVTCPVSGARLLEPAS